MNNISTIKVLVANSNQLMQNGIVEILSKKSDVFIFGDAVNGDELIDKYSKLMPDIVLSEISMPGKSGLDAMKIILEIDKSAKFLFFSNHNNDFYICKCLELGACGLLSNSATEGELFFAIKTIMEGNNYYGSLWNKEKLDNLMKKYKAKPVLSNYISEIKLNYREEQIVNHISNGKQSSEIAIALELSKRTIDMYRSQLMKKLGIKTLIQLVVFSVHYTIQKENENLLYTTETPILKTSCIKNFV